MSRRYVLRTAIRHVIQWTGANDIEMASFIFDHFKHKDVKFKRWEPITIGNQVVNVGQYLVLDSQQQTFTTWGDDVFTANYVRFPND